MFTIWPYLLRLAVALYFIYPHGHSLMLGITKIDASIFGCINDYIPMTIAYAIYHTFFIILGLLILVWPTPVLPLVVALCALSVELYINFSKNNYAAENMLLFILVLVTLALIIYHARPQLR